MRKWFSFQLVVRGRLEFTQEMSAQLYQNSPLRGESEQTTRRGSRTEAKQMLRMLFAYRLALFFFAHETPAKTIPALGTPIAISNYLPCGKLTSGVAN